MPSSKPPIVPRAQSPVLRSSLARHPGRQTLNPDELAAMRRRAWRDQAVAVLPLDLLADPWERQFVANLATRLYGKREDRR